MSVERIALLSQTRQGGKTFAMAYARGVADTLKYLHKKGFKAEIVLIDGKEKNTGKHCDITHDFIWDKAVD